MQQATYSRIERGQLSIEAEILSKLVERLNITVNEFFYIHQGYKTTKKQDFIQSFARMELVLEDEIEKQLAEIKKYLSFIEIKIF